LDAPESFLEPLFYAWFVVANIAQLYNKDEEAEVAAILSFEHVLDSK